MKLKLVIILFFFIMLLTHYGCNADKNTNSKPERIDSAVVSKSPLPTEPFPSYKEEYGPPDWWTARNAHDNEAYPIFRLNYDPELVNKKFLGDCEKGDCPWKEFSFKEQQPDYYLRALIKYAFEGNLEVNWVVQKNKIRKWFNAPYMHLDIVKPVTTTCSDSKPCEDDIEEKVAREFIHGMTMERTASLAELNYAPDVPIRDAPTDKFQSWAISFYNERGASHIAKVWNEVMHPKSGIPDPQNFPKGFPDGTVAVKLLFTEAPPDKVSYLKGSIEWNADIGKEVMTADGKKVKRAGERGETEQNCIGSLEKCFSTLRLLQVDLAIRDDRKGKEESPTGWVFATFTYDEAAPPYVPREDQDKPEIRPWLKLSPLGLMFGNDPLAQKGDKLTETTLYRNITIPQHYGCGEDGYDNRFNRRLNGPVDNPASSCISCHAQSETPRDLNIGSIPYGCLRCDSKFNIAEWFRNINPRNPSAPTLTISDNERQVVSLDFSLQLREGIRRYCVESFNKGENACKLGFKRGDTITSFTRDGPHSFAVQ